MQVIENKLSIMLLNETTIAKQSEVAVPKLTIKHVQDKGALLAQLSNRLLCLIATQTELVGS